MPLLSVQTSDLPEPKCHPMPHPAATSCPGSLTVKSLVNKETGYFLPETVGLVGRDWGGPWVPWKQSDFSIRQT